MRLPACGQIAEYFISTLIEVSQQRGVTAIHLLLHPLQRLHRPPQAPRRPKKPATSQSGALQM
jgi:hypothetical protein